MGFETLFYSDDFFRIFFEMAITYGFFGGFAIATLSIFLMYVIFKAISLLNK